LEARGGEVDSEGSSWNEGGSRGGQSPRKGGLKRKEDGGGKVGRKEAKRRQRFKVWGDVIWILTRKGREKIKGRNRNRGAGKSERRGVSGKWVGFRGK